MLLIVNKKELFEKLKQNGIDNIPIAETLLNVCGVFIGDYYLIYDMGTLSDDPFVTLQSLFARFLDDVQCLEAQH